MFLLPEYCMDLSNFGVLFSDLLISRCTIYPAYKYNIYNLIARFVIQLIESSVKVKDSFQISKSLLTLLNSTLQVKSALGALFKHASCDFEIYKLTFTFTESSNMLIYFNVLLIILIWIKRKHSGLPSPMTIFSISFQYQSRILLGFHISMGFSLYSRKASKNIY